MKRSKRPSAPQEVEIKLAAAELDELGRVLRAAGAFAAKATGNGTRKSGIQRSGQVRGAPGKTYSQKSLRWEGRVFEHNVLFDLPGQPIRKRGALLRLRWQAPAGKGMSQGKWNPSTGTAFLTYKGRASTESGYKVADELETEVEDPERLMDIFKAIGFRPSFRYEKFRTEFRVAGVSGLVLDVDETPMGNFVELEGPRKAIDRVAAVLGRSRDEYLTGSYAALHREFCRRQGRPFGDMLFPRRKK